MSLRFASHRREECANRPRHEFVPKTLTDLAIDEHGSIEAGINGGRFRHPSNSFSSHSSSSQNHHQHAQHSFPHARTGGGSSRTGGSSNHPHSNGHHQYPAIGGGGSTANRNIYSSQQNLSKHSNFGRNRTFGSQQSLNNAGGAADAVVGNGGGGSNASNNNGSDTTDVWLNAWSSPPAATAAPAYAGTVLNGAASSNNGNGNGHRTTTNSGHPQKSLFSDPWTG